MNISLFYLSEQCIGGACNCSLQCSSKNGFCDDGVCTCNDTDFVNAIGVCETRKFNKAI